MSVYIYACFNKCQMSGDRLASNMLIGLADAVPNRCRNRLKNMY